MTDNRQYLGCIPQPPDIRDVPLGANYVEGVEIDWNKGTGRSDLYSKLKVEHQGTTWSCVAQAISKYLEYLNLVELGEVYDLSARFIYSQIYLPRDGAYIRDGIKVAIKQGDCQEKLMSSYMPDGGNPNEQFMRGRLELNQSEVKKDALNYRAQNQYGWVADGRDFDLLAKIIQKYYGFVSGFNGHAILFLDYLIKDGKKTLKYIDSYGVENGDNGYKYYSEGNPYPLYNAVALIDAESYVLQKTLMKKIIIDKTNGEQYLKNESDLFHIPDIETRDLLFQMEICSPELCEEADNLDGLVIKDEIPSVRVCKSLESLYPILRDAYDNNKLPESIKVSLVDKLANIFSGK